MPALQTRQASVSVQNSQDFFRLFQMLESAGDIFEIDEGALLLSVGPQSDLANYKVDFFSAQAQDNVDELFLAVNNPFVGRLDARNATPYPRTTLDDGQGLNAKTLITARDLVDNDFLPSFFSEQDGDFVASRIKPQIDVFAYFQNPGIATPQRDDREYPFPFISTAAAPTSAFYFLPYYGRRYGHVNLVNRNAAATTYTANVYGINLSAGTKTTAVIGASKAAETLLGTINAASGITADLVFDQSKGLFDLLVIDLTNDVGLFDPDSTLRITVSDRG